MEVGDLHKSYLAALVALLATVPVSAAIMPASATEPSSEIIYRINTGGPLVPAAPQWTRDGSRRKSSFLLTPNTKTAFTRNAIEMDHPSVAEGTPATVFSHQRNRARGKAIHYGFPVDAGTFKVHLLFAEIRPKAQAVGKRIMRVSIEGVRVLNRYDVFRNVGGRRAVVKSFTTTSDQVLNIKLRGIKGRAMIGGIEILRASTAVEPQPKPDPSAPAALEPVGNCWGVKVAGGGDALVQAMTSHSGGTTFCMDPGTYTAGANGFPIESGDTLHGSGVTETFLSSDVASRVLDGRRAHGVNIIGVNISGGRDDGGKDACDTVHGRCGRGIEPGDNWTIRNSRVHHADTSGISSPGHSLVVDNVEIDHNGLQWNGPESNGISAGIKGGEAGAFTITNSFVHDNNQGIWCDVDCHNLYGGFAVEDNRVLDNCSFGVHYENTYKDPSTPASATIRGNVVKGNNWCNLASKADVGIVSAENASVNGNELGATVAHPKTGYGFTAFDRGRGPASGSAFNNSMNGDTIRKCQSPYSCK